jgi:hypothetical protein
LMNTLTRNRWSFRVNFHSVRRCLMEWRWFLEFALRVLLVAFSDGNCGPHT